MVEAQLKRLQKKLVALKKEIDEVKREKEAAMQVQIERLDKFIAAVAFGNVQISRYVDSIDYRHLVECIKANAGHEEDPLNALVDAIENQTLSFEEVTACLDSDYLTFYTDAAKGREKFRLKVSEFTTTDLNLDILDSETPSVLLVVGECSEKDKERDRMKEQDREPNSDIVPFFILKIKEAEMGKWAAPLKVEVPSGPKLSISPKMSRRQTRVRMSKGKGDLDLLSAVAKLPSGSRKTDEDSDAKDSQKDPKDAKEPKEPKEPKDETRPFQSSTFAALKDDSNATDSVQDALLFEAMTRSKSAGQRPTIVSEPNLASVPKPHLGSIDEVEEEGETRKHKNEPPREPLRSFAPLAFDLENDPDGDPIPDALDLPISDYSQDRSSIRPNRDDSSEGGDEEQVEMEPTLAEAMQALQTGCEFKKFGRQGQPHNRYVFAEKSQLVWKDPIQGKVCGRVALTEIKEVIEGRTTKPFLKFPTKSAKEIESSFSIIGLHRNLDLQASDPITKKR